MNRIGMLACWSLSVLAAASGVASAQADACTTRNLLASLQPSQIEGVSRAASLLTDGAVSPEGARWNETTAVLLDSDTSSITFDLGQLRQVSAVYLQGDANDTYRLSGSADASVNSFTTLVELPNVVTLGHGLRNRVARLPPVQVRYLRLSNPAGDAFYSASELAVYCQAPEPFPPVLRIVAPVADTPAVDALQMRDDDATQRRMAWLWFGLALLAVAALAWRFIPQRALSVALPSAAAQPTAAARDEWLERLLLGVFVASGCAALIYEIVWLHLLRLVVGASSLSVGIVLASFMGGMFAGSLGFGRWVSRKHNPLLVYAALELGIGLCGLAMPVLLPIARSVYADAAGHGPLGIALRALIAAVMLLPPTALMGATLPAISRRYADQTHQQARSRLAALYAANTLGAVAGCLLCGFYLLAVWDVWVATFSAVALNVSIAALAYAARNHASSVVGTETQPDSAPRVSASDAAPAIYLAIGLSGLTALGAQVLWTRLLTLLFGATVYAFSIILAVFLAGLGLGAVAATRALRRGIDPLRGLGFTQLGLVPVLLWAALLLADVLPYSSPATITPISALHWLHVLRAIEVMLPAAILWGMSFPLALAAVQHADPSRATGQVYAANTIGAIIGALSVSFWAIPAHGTHWASQAITMLAGLSAAIVVGWPKPSPQARARLQPSAALAVLALGALCAAAAPGVPGIFLAHGRHIWSVDARDTYPYISEGAASTVAVHVAPDGSRHFHVSGRVEASNNPADLRLERLLGHLSALAHPKPERVLVVGLGAGVTAGSLALHPEVKRLVICEIEPRVTGAARQFASENYHVLDDPRVQVVFDDARHFLATSDERFDIITSDPIHPWVRGNSVLFSREYYEIVKTRLAPGGIATQWVPLYDTSEEAIQIQMRTFLAAFPNGSVWNSSASGRGYDVVLLGRATDNPLDVPAVERRMQQPAIAASLREVGVQSVYDLFATYAAGASDMRGWVAHARENRDFSLKLEYISGLSLNQQIADPIYAHMVAQRSVPKSLFAGPPEMLSHLYARLAQGPGVAAAP